MGEIINILIVMEMLTVNLLIVNVCGNRKYSAIKTISILLGFTIFITGISYQLWDASLDFNKGNGLFALIGIVYLIPLKFLYKEQITKIMSILFSSWIYTMMIFSLSIHLANIIEEENFLIKVFTIQTFIYILTLYIFIYWIKNGFLYVLHNTSQKINHFLHYISFCWFITIVIINLSLIYADSNILKICSLSILIINIILSYLLIYFLVKSMRDIENLEEIIFIDPLTKLKNRAKLFVDGEILIKQQKPFCLIFIDLDHFKSINDHYGHLIGDSYLCFFANTTKKIIGENGVLYRMSGDEFICIYTGEEKTNFLEAMKHYPDILPNSDISFLGYSIGCAEYPKEASSLDDIIRLADKRMYQNKHKLKN